VTPSSLVTVPEDLVPSDLEDTRSIAQHFLVDSRKAATVLGWQPSDPADRIPRLAGWVRAAAHDQAEPSGMELRLGVAVRMGVD
jgi:hypothetical protein